MNSREKVLDVERQLRAMISGQQEPTFTCPFCNTISNEFNELLCCQEAADTINAVLDHIDFKQAVERAEVVMEKVDKMRSVILN